MIVPGTNSLQMAPSFAKLRSMSFPPTTEQQLALDAFATGGDMVIEAGAGTGKTTTLRLLAESTHDRGLYIAYNKAIATDAKADFPSNVECSTAHSLAYRSIMKGEHRGLLNKLRTNSRVPSKVAVAILGIPPGGLNVNSEHHLPAWTIARLAMDTVNRFCYSADEEIKGYHVPKVEGVDDHSFLSNYVLPFARKTWSDLLSPTGKLRFAHDHYLKLWALSNPILNADFILFDEAQDANPVIAGVVLAQDAQKIMVGDRCQAIYGWRGAVDAMTTFKADHRLMLSQSFRFGPAVAAEANKFLGLLDAPLRLSGFDKIESTTGSLSDPDAILCRTNAEVIAQAMQAQAAGKRVAIVGGTAEIKRFTEGARDLMTGRTANHPDLMAFKSWADVQAYVQDEEGRDLKVMVKLIDNYGVPAILAVCDASESNEADADLIVSTAHKAKGREWNKVLIANDFNEPEEGNEPSKPEMMLMYVAVTRAKLVLDHLSLEWINRFVGQEA